LEELDGRDVTTTESIQAKDMYSARGALDAISNSCFLRIVAVRLFSVDVRNAFRVSPPHRRQPRYAQEYAHPLHSSTIQDYSAHRQSDCKRALVSNGRQRCKSMIFRAATASNQ